MSAKASFDKTKNALFIQSLNVFISGVVAVILPLVMQERKISIETIGLIFAILPIVTQFTRLLFGVMSDFLGRRLFYLLNALMNLFYLTVYFFAYSPLEFLFGKITEGVRNASLWSVNRPYLLDHSYDKRGILIRMRSISLIFSAIGSLSAGFLLSYLLYSNTILLLILLSLFFLPFASNLEDKVKKKLSIKEAWKHIDLRNRSKTFKKFLLIFIVKGTATGAITGYVLPLFLKQTGLTVKYIGLIIGLELFLSGIVLHFLISRFTFKTLITLAGIFFSIITILLGFSNIILRPGSEIAMILSALLVLMLGIALGVSSASHEIILTKVADHRSYGGDIGLIMTGLHIGFTISFSTAGFIIASYGYGLFFFLSAVLYIIYAAFSYKNL